MRPLAASLPSTVYVYPSDSNFSFPSSIADQSTVETLPVFLSCMVMVSAASSVETSSRSGFNRTAISAAVFAGFADALSTKFFALFTQKKPHAATTMQPSTNAPAQPMRIHFQGLLFFATTTGGGGGGGVALVVGAMRLLHIDRYARRI